MVVARGEVPETLRHRVWTQGKRERLSSECSDRGTMEVAFPGRRLGGGQRMR